MLNQESILDKVTLSKTYIITGISGSGKTSLAYEIFKKFIKEITPETYHTFPLNYPDFHYLKGGKIEEVRELLKKLNSKPFYKEHFVLLDEINKMSIEGQNILLKTLEESKVNFILTSNNDAFVLKTIFSRTYKITPNLLTLEIIKEELRKVCDDENYIEIVSDLSLGSLGKALSYCENENLKSFILELESLSSKNSFILASKCKEYKEERKEIFYLIKFYIKKLMVKGVNYKECYELILLISKYERDLINNANISMIYENIFDKLIKLAREVKQ